MRIGIDARFYGPRVGGGGIGRYVEELIKHLEKIDRSNEYVIFLRKENWDDYHLQFSNFSKVLAPWRWYTFGEQFGLPKLIKLSKIDLLHTPHFNISIFSKVPFVVTIHDLLLLEYPSARASTLGPLFFWLKYSAFRFILFLGLKRARHIIAVSQTTKDDILRRFHIPPEKITVVYSGFTPKPIAELTSLSGMPSAPYLLTVGNAYPHKNIDGLIQSFCDIIKSVPEIKLVITGPDDFFRSRLRELSLNLGMTEKIIFTGFVDEQTLDALYKNAKAIIIPSFMEGFSFPGLEAQLRGVPVLASDIGAHREIFAASALYFNPKDLVSISQTVKDFLNEPHISDTLCEKGLQNYKKYNWEETAQKTLEIYGKVLQS